MVEKVCYNCKHEKCATCDSNYELCDSCRLGYYYLDKLCYDECPDCIIIFSFCILLYKFFSEGYEENFLGRTCDPVCDVLNCKACAGNNLNNCIECNTDYYLGYDN